MIGIATIWLPPDRPVAVRRWVRARAGRELPGAEDGPRPVRNVGRTTLALALVWVLVQALVPLRHVAIPGDVRWTEEAAGSPGV